MIMKEIGSIACLVVQVPLCSAVLVNLLTPILRPFGETQTGLFFEKIAGFSAHIENLCENMRFLRRGHE